MKLATEMRGNAPTAGARQAGFSVLEMTMGMVLFGIVLGSMLGLLEVGRKTRSNTMATNDDVQGVRIALNQMQKDVLNAGVDYPNSGATLPTNWLYNHLGLAKSSPTGTVDSLTPVVPGYGPGLTFAGSDPPNSTLSNNVSSPTSTVVCDQVTLVSVNYLFDASTVGTGITTVNPVSMAGSNTVNTGSQTATLQITSPANNSLNSSSVCNVGDVYYMNWAADPTGIIGIVTSLGQTSKANDSIVLASSGDPLGLNSFATTSSTAPPYDIGAVGGVSTVSAYKLDFVTYYVKDDGTGKGTGVLMRRSYGGASGGSAQKWTDQPLAFNVTSMTVNYTLSDQTVTRNPTLAQFQNIRQIAVSITVQSQNRMQVANESKQATTGSGTYNTQTLTAVMNTRNLGYEKN